MRRLGIYFVLVTALIAVYAGASRKTASTTKNRPDYPPAHRGDQVDIYHGVEVADPYRWLEEETAPATRKWIEAQDRLLEGYVSAVPDLDGIEARLARIRKFDRYSTPTRRGERYFYTRTDAGATHGVLFVQDGLDGKPRPVIDFAEVIAEPTHSMGGTSTSWDGRHVVWSSQDPSRWGWLDVARVQDGKLLGERIMGIAGNSAIWTHDSRGFFYTTYGDYEELLAGTAEPRPQLFYHRLGSDTAQDELVYAREDRPNMLFSPKLSDDGRYLVVGLNDGTSTKNQVIYKDLKKSGSDWISLISEADAGFYFEANAGQRFFFRTTLDAPQGRLIAIDLERPQRQHWEDVIPRRESNLNAISHIGGRLVAQISEHARPRVEVRSYDGKLERTLELPDIGLISGFSDDPESPIAFFRLNNLYDPGTIYRVDLRKGRSEVQQSAGLSYDPGKYEIRQVFYESSDGTRIPMFLAHRKDVPLKSNRPLYMYGFGHSGWVAFPWFQPMLVEWLDRGGIYALPGIRGGGEYGAEWQEAGTLLNKVNTIADYVAAAEWLIKQGYTSPTKLVANGGSASGVVPAAAVVRRPELFAAAVIDFPFLDMLRYHEFTTIKGWTRGYGSSADPEEFKVLMGYSPLHGLKKGECYPAFLTIVSEKDTSTVPMHGYKFTAALQWAQGCEQPGMLKFIPGAGHYSYGTTAEKAVETEAQVLAFLIRALGLESGPSWG